MARWRRELATCHVDEPDLTHLDIRVKVMYAAMNTHVQNIASTIRIL